MLALIAGTGDLPAALVARRARRPLICALQGFEPTIPVDITFRLEHLGSLLAQLQTEGVTQVCMAGAIRRPNIEPDLIDEKTKPLVPQVMAALGQGDGGALKVVISIFEDAGFHVLAAHEIAPDLLPPVGVLTAASPTQTQQTDATLGATCLVDMGAADVGQACLINEGKVIATESQEGTEALLRGAGTPFKSGPDDSVVDGLADIALGVFDSAADFLVGGPAPTHDLSGAMLFKAPKPNQDWRADLPVIGAQTADQAVRAGLSGIVIEAGGVMVLDLPVVIATLDAHGWILWVRRKGAQ